jgi:redox-sensitive bicupin YhaK (pirin superfamily)
MIQVRKADARGHANHGWLDTYHSFSFANYYDPRFMGFSTLRVINEDVIAPGAGFPKHPHKDMEIVTFLLDGELEHRDSMDNHSVIRAGEIQRMSAGNGVFHSEFNPSPVNPTHLLQIWILPNKRGFDPGYEQKWLPELTKESPVQLIASPEGRDGSVTIHQDTDIWLARMGAGQKVEHSLKGVRSAWVQVARGTLKVGEHQLKAGDGAAVSQEKALTLASDDGGEALIFDMP